VADRPVGDAPQPSLTNGWFLVPARAPRVQAMLRQGRLPGGDYDGLARLFAQSARSSRDPYGGYVGNVGTELMYDAGAAFPMAVEASTSVFPVGGVQEALDAGALVGVAPEVTLRSFSGRRSEAVLVADLATSTGVVRYNALLLAAALRAVGAPARLIVPPKASRLGPGYLVGPRGTAVMMPMRRE